MNEYRETFEKASFVIVFQHFLPLAEYNNWKKKMRKACPGITIKSHFKNKMIRVLLKEEFPNYEHMSGLFTGPVGIITGNNPETIVEDLTNVLSTQPPKTFTPILWMGGGVEDGVVSHEDLKRLAGA